MRFNVIAQYHPAAALHQPRLWATLLDDWQNLPESEPHDFKLYSISKLNLAGMPLAALDTETNNMGGLGVWSIAFRDGEGTLSVATFNGSDVRRGIEFASCPVALHNAKYDLRELRANKMPVPEKFHDSMILAYCLGLGKQAPKEDSKSKSGSDMVGGLGLKYLARRHLGMNMMTWQEVKDHPEKQVEYNANDSVATYLLAEKWLPKAPKHYFDIDLPLISVLMSMEDRGIQVDPDVLVSLGKELDNRLAGYDLPINPFSPQQLQSYLYGILELEPWKFTETGAPSADDEVLEVVNDPVIQQVLEFKRLAKEKGTYVDNYIKAMGQDGRIHPEIKQTSTSTGRLSIARPALQNVFKRDERVKLRAFLTARDGYRIVRADFNQLEFRTLAAITQDQVLIKALNENKKIHQVTADIMGIPYDDAKTVNFGMMFGQEAWSLSSQLHITIGQAREFLSDYFTRFPGIKLYREQMTESAKKDKKAVVPFTGRTRRIDAMYVEQWRIQQEGIKEAVNLPVQGLGAEVIKICMIDLHQKHNAPMVLMVHDELLFEVPDKEAVEYAHWIKDYIPTIVEFGGMKFPVEVGVGNNWYEAMNSGI